MDFLTKRNQVRCESVFTEVDLHKLLKVADDEWRGMIATGLCTGQLVSKLCQIQRDKVDAVHWTLTVRRHDVEVEIPIIQPLRPYINPVLQDRKPKEPIFPRAYRWMETNNGRTSRVSQEFARLLSRAELARITIVELGTGTSPSGTLNFSALRRTLRRLLYQMPTRPHPMLIHSAKWETCVCAPPEFRNPLEDDWIVDRLARFLNYQ